MTATAPDSAATDARIPSLDVIRGAVMVLMAIDHVRVFSGLPAGGPTAGIFFTRWVTHFCAPAFVFLAGTSAFLYGRRHADVTRFLLTRGAWLVFLELTLLRVGWTFNFDFAHYQMAGVIWVIGWSMIALAGLARLPIKAVAAFGVGVIVAHNLLGPPISGLLAARGVAGAALSSVLYDGFFNGPIPFGTDGPSLIVLYSLVPWVGVMAAGYAFGVIVTMPAERRNRRCYLIGFGAIACFVLLRGLNLYGDPNHWGSAAGYDGQPMPAWLSFLNTTKYPASLLFLLMTLGPTIALIPPLERARGGVTQVLSVFGKVPFFYYVLHIPLVHALAIVVSLVRSGSVSPWLFANHPMGNGPPPAGYTWSLALLYLVFATAMLLLYPACRWYAALKSRRNDWWLRYL